MFDFLKIIKNYQRGRYYYQPTFITKSSIKDVMTRGGSFYAIYDETTGLWTKEKTRAIELIDQQVREYAEKDSGEIAMQDSEHGPVIMPMSDSANHLVERFERFCKTMGDFWVPLDQKMIFSNTEVKKADYASKKLDYPLQEQPTPYYDTLTSVLYLPDEQEKWEWAVGAMISGDSSKIQKMFAFYGEPGKGKSTIISKIFAEQIFGDEDGYAKKFEANNLCTGDNFATDFLANDSILVYDDDAEMGMISVRSTLNKIISHESVRVNGKFERTFYTKPKCMIFVGSNDPIQLSPNSGMKRRLIDIRPTGNLLEASTYDDCMEHIPFEKSGIAWKCLQVYKKLGRHYYDHYIAEDMLARTSPFHNYVIENVMELKDGISLANAYDMYLRYAEMCKFKNEMPRYKFRDTLKLYFDQYEDSKFSGFRWDKIGKEKPVEVKIDIPSWLKFNCTKSLLDDLYATMPAQLANDEGLPKQKWENVKTTLADIDTTKLHYTKVPDITHIVVDFDIRDEDGKKSLEKNMEAASKFSPTYAELSKSGCGIHLHYIYTGGDAKDLSNIYDSNVEIKVFTGNAALRRQLTLCNDIPIAEISSGLPLKDVKGGKKMVDWDGYKNEKVLRSMIVKNLKKEYHPATKPSIDYIDALLKQAYESGVTYDVRDMQNDILVFAMGSTNQADYCVNIVSNMLLCSKDILDKEKEDELASVDEEAPIVIYDVEIAPSYKQYVEYCEKDDIPIDTKVPKNSKAHFLLCWKFLDDEKYIWDKKKDIWLNPGKKIKSVSKLLDPKPEEVAKLFKYRLIGFNNRSYDNHMIWAASQGYTPEELYSLNSRIINEKDSKARFGQAYNLSYTDILDFATGDNKKGLKKWQIQLKIRHKEWSEPWYKPIPDDKLVEWADYCSNDVTTTEALFDRLEDDYEARLILAKIAGGTANDTTNTLTTKLLTHGIADPQSEYIYTDLSTIFPGYEFHPEGIPKERYSTEPGTKVSTRKSIYMGEDPSEGGYANCPRPGIYYNVGLFDVASEHPHSAIRLKAFGETITKRYENLVEARVSIKHIREIGDDAYNEALRRMEAIKEGSSEVLKDILVGLSGDALKAKCKAIANALKIAINSVYGLTAAKFDNKLRDPRNVDNIVAKYGALFMITLKHKLQEMGYTVVHIKTDSIKVADYDEKCKKFIMEFGKKYGFTFEHEATYAKICIVDDAQYVAYEVEADGEPLEKPFWTVTGAKFAAPYLFKNLFSHEEITFDDYPETKSVDDAALYLITENGTENFVGRVGSFVCVKPEYGASLMRVKGDKKSAVTGTKGYFWAEADSVREHPERLNLDYYRSKCDDAIESINEYGDFDIFSESPFTGMNPPE